MHRRIVKTSQHEFRVMQSQRVQTNERKGEERERKKKKKKKKNKNKKRESEKKNKKKKKKKKGGKKKKKKKSGVGWRLREWVSHIQCGLHADTYQQGILHRFLLSCNGDTLSTLCRPFWESTIIYI